MMPDWLTAILIVAAWIDGFFVAWAMCHQDKPRWRGYLDGRSLRFWR